MTTGHVFIAISLDGFIARRDGNIDWLMKQQTSGEDHGYDAFMASVDGIIMGRGTFEKVLTFGDWSYPKPVVVMSGTLNDADIPGDLRDKVQVSALGPAEIMRELADKGWARAYVDGGRVIQSFLQAGLISDMTLTHIPVLIGEGLPLFGKLDRDIDLEHLETRSFPSGLVSSTYRVRQAGNRTP
ncbi:dihydrofolate reductase family protein [Anderseniella sp. Alg231-50]|uniref:dihydrofolate reductase family protein n=1 Tax=Anderseniella sp. Alg231-50 TaxID=1922226 RepID=UPI000D556B46